MLPSLVQVESWWKASGGEVDRERPSCLILTAFLAPLRRQVLQEEEEEGDTSTQQKERLEQHALQGTFWVGRRINTNPVRAMKERRLKDKDKSKVMRKGLVGSR